MRTTVGPLPPAVYWRRRAVVLGALLLGVIVLFVSCSGHGHEKARATNAASHGPITTPSAPTPSDTESFASAIPGGGGQPLPAPSDQPSLGDDPNGGAATQNPTGTNQNATAPTGETCADSEMSITPVPASPRVKRGSPIGIRLKIKNIGSRTCKRDVGADPQELYLDQGARKYWSSDTCSAVHGSDVEVFTAGAEREFAVTWNGRQTSKCEAALPAGPAPIPGQYELRARLGAKISDPVVLTIIA